MKTVQIEKESIRNQIVGRDGIPKSPKPYVAEFFIEGNGNDAKVRKNFLKPIKTKYIEDEQRHYTWEAPQDVPIAIGTCKSYNEFTVEEGMYINGVWKEMTFREIGDFLKAEAANAKQAAKDHVELPNSLIADDPFEGNT
jgi:hypothetical protein